jgi:hypothetical protein
MPVFWSVPSGRTHLDEAEHAPPEQFAGANGWVAGAAGRRPHGLGWEAASGGDDGAYEAEFDFSGGWLETEVEVVDAAGFPAAVRQAVHGVTRGGHVDKWEIEVTPAGEFYEVEILGSDGEHYFDAAGRPAENQFEDA